MCYGVNNDDKCYCGDNDDKCYGGNSDAMCYGGNSVVLLARQTLALDEWFLLQDMHLLLQYV